MSRRFSDMLPHEQHSLRFRVFEYIREDILNGRYKPGDSLVETKLAEEIGVSRTPIREAIRQLELEGLVTFYPNKGVFVTGITEQDVHDIYTIRSMIEGLAARWAARRADENELGQLEETVELMEYYTRKNDLEQVSRLDTRFHDLIYSSCKSKFIKHTLSSLLKYVWRARLGSLKVPKRAQISLREHREILEAIIQKDAERAEKLMLDHISHASHNLHTSYLDEENKTE